MKNLMTSLLALAAVAPLAFAATVSPPVAPAVSAGGNSFNPVFSADGQKLVFVSHANNLVTNDDHGLWLDVFVRDLVTSNTVLVSVGTNGTGGANADANYPVVSSNGQFVAFASSASNLAPVVSSWVGSPPYLFSGDPNGVSDVFWRDLGSGITRVVSLSDNALFPPAQASDHPLISANGRWVFFESRATTLTFPPIASGGVNIFARDMWSNSTVLVTVTTNGDGITGQATLNHITPDARFAAFTSATALVPGPLNNNQEVFVRDLQTSNTVWVSTNVASLLVPGGNDYRCSAPVLSDDGRFVAFLASQLFNQAHVLRHDLQSGTTLLLSGAGTNLSHGLQMSADGRFVLFQEMTNGFSQVKLWDAQSGVATNVTCSNPGFAGNATMSADAARIAFIGCSNVYVRDLASGHQCGRRARGLRHRRERPCARRSEWSERHLPARRDQQCDGTHHQGRALEARSHRLRSFLPRPEQRQRGRALHRLHAL
jgi:Tol biopolymer transport system component